jgi:cellulose synthase/poly-beta-1,6-N-acetylglucosamine synthase-like glycosyltransferase
MGAANVYFRLNKNNVMHFLIAFTGTLLFFYALLIFYYHWIWDKIPGPAPTLPDESLISEKNLAGAISFKTSTDSAEVLAGNLVHEIPVMPVGLLVSIIIPARNEAKRIGPCLDALLNQSYSRTLTEIIVVNDFSTDETATLVQGHPLKCTVLNLADYVTDGLNSYKKKAIETGIRHCHGELIMCTDADCTMGPYWIHKLVETYQRNKFQFIAAPVKIIPGRSWLAVFQTLDFISLQGITGAAVFRNLYPMCNGANLAYSKKAFEAVNGFLDIDHIASGDDMMLLKKIQEKYPGKTGYVKDEQAIVNTVPAENIGAFLNQRIRWASKIAHYKHPSTFITLGLVYTVNAGLLLLFFCCLLYGKWRWLLILLAFKTVSEYFFVSKVAGFFGQRSLMKWFPFCQPIHIIYTVIAGGFGSFGKYEWKNRKVR